MSSSDAACVCGEINSRHCPVHGQGMTAATCSRCGHEKAEHGNDVLRFAPCQHLVEGRPATMRLLPYAYATESCWCPNYEEAEVEAASR